MTGTLFLSCYGYVYASIVDYGDECAVVQEVDDGGVVHSSLDKTDSGVLDNSKNQNSDTLEDKSEENNTNESDYSDNKDKTFENASTNDSSKNSQKTTGSNGNGGSSIGISSGDNSGQEAETRRRWIPEKVEYIKHPAVTKKVVKQYKITCMCGVEFTGRSIPDCAAKWQAHRPNP